jgi:leader peptidase (prepilin peptidase)/N-methyltransferase
VEAVTGFLFAAAFICLNPLGVVSAVLLLKFWIILAALVVIFVVDLEHFLILDSVIFPAAGAVLVLNIALDYFSKIGILSMRGNFVSGLIAAAVLWLLFYLVWRISSGKWLGFGDVKLAILLGLVLGWPLILVGFMLAVLLGGVVSVFLLVFGGKNLKSQIPFGTFLAVGTILALFYGDKLLHWYLAILGF